MRNVGRKDAVDGALLFGSNCMACVQAAAWETCEEHYTSGCVIRVGTTECVAQLQGVVCVFGLWGRVIFGGSKGAE